MTHSAHLLTKLAFGSALATGMLASTHSASAQTTMRVAIPFSFTADNVSVPAGNYTVSTRNGSFLVFSNTDTGTTKTVIIRQEEGNNSQGASRLTFQRQPGGIYLVQVWSSGTNVHSVLTSHPKPAQEMSNLKPSISTFDIATK